MSRSLEYLDVLSNIFYVQSMEVALNELATNAVQIEKYRPETCCIIGGWIWCVLHARCSLAAMVEQPTCTV